MTKTPLMILLSLVLSVLLAACTASPVQVAEPTDTPPEQLEPLIAIENLPNCSDAVRKNLLDMLPILDSILRTITEGESIYAPEDASFLWRALYYMGVNWGDTSPSVKAGDGFILVPRAVMEKFAAAIYAGYMQLPEVPQDCAEMVIYDQSQDAYRLTGSDMSENSVEILDFAVNGNEVNVQVGFNDSEGTRIGATAFLLTPNAYADAASQPNFVYSVAFVIPVENDSTEYWRQMDPELPISADLDGDGEPELITVTVDEEAYTTSVTISTANGELSAHEDVALFWLACHVGDTLREDGSAELYLTGDMASADYITIVYRIKDGELLKAEIDGIVSEVYGDGTLSVQTAINVLGTWSGQCLYELGEDLVFTRITPYTHENQVDEWEYRSLTVKRDGLNAEELLLDGGTQLTTLPVGTKFMPYETDGETYVAVETQEHTRYRLEISQKAGEWGWYIGDIAEVEWFEENRYSG